MSSSPPIPSSSLPPRSHSYAYQPSDGTSGGSLTPRVEPRPSFTTSLGFRSPPVSPPGTPPHPPMTLPPGATTAAAAPSTSFSLMSPLGASSVTTSESEEESGYDPMGTTFHHVRRDVRSAPNAQPLPTSPPPDLPPKPYEHYPSHPYQHNKHPSSEPLADHHQQQQQQRAKTPTPSTRSNLAAQEFAPQAGTGVSHLPAIPKGSIEPTAYANWEVARDLEFGMARVLGEHVLDEVMRDRGAQKSFREFVALQPESNPLMVDFLHDLRVFSDLSTQLRTACRSIEAIYLLKSSPHRLALPISIRGTVLESFHLTSTVGTGVTEPMKELLMRLYEREFQAYMLQKLVESAVARLGNVRLNPVGVDAKERDGLADCYCLTNPRLRDHPIILASEGFVELTGYPLSMIVGRNCRFLQGPGTSPESVTRLRVALNAGKSITSLLLNYRMNGEPFFNLLCMLPLKHSSGLVKYFLGGQIDVTGSIHQLLSQGSSDAGSSIRQGSRSTRFSPAVQSYAEELLASAKRAGTAGAHPTPGGGLEGAGRVRRQGSISTFESDVDTSGARSVGTGTTGSQKSTSASFVGPKRSRKASKRNELGMTMEEQAVLTSSEAANPFLDKLAEFQATYSRVIVVHQRTREVLYFTPELAEFCNLTPQQAEDLIGTDFVKHLVGVPTERTMHLQEFIKSTIKKGQAYASAVGLAPRAKKGFLKKREDMEPKHCILHLTPLANQNGAVEAFVAVFGTTQAVV